MSPGESWILALDTAERTAGSVALVSARHSLVRDLDPVERHSQSLIPAIRELLKTSGVEPHGLRGIAVVRGPGSFIGLRVGIATAQGLAAGWGVRLAGVDTLRAEAVSAFADKDPSGNPDALVAALVDARRQEVYAAVYVPDSGRLRRLLPPRAETIEAFVLRLPPRWNVHLTGGGADLYHDRLSSLLGSRAHFVPAGERGSRVVTVARLARFSESIVGWPTVDPVYVRKGL